MISILLFVVETFYCSRTYYHKTNVSIQLTSYILPLYKVHNTVIVLVEVQQQNEYFESTYILRQKYHHHNNEDYDVDDDIENQSPTQMLYSQECKVSACFHMFLVHESKTKKRKRETQLQQTMYPNILLHTPNQTKHTVGCRIHLEPYMLPI